MNHLLNLSVVFFLGISAVCVADLENVREKSQMPKESAHKEANAELKEKSRRQYAVILARLKGGMEDKDGRSKEQRRREWRLRRSLANAFVRWAQTRESAAAEECDALLASVMEADDVGVKPLFYSAQLAHLRGNTEQAMSLLAKAIHMYPDATGLGTALPVNIQAWLWMATMQRQAGDGPGAVETYHAVKKLLDLEERDQRLVLAVCWLNIAQIAAERTADTELFHNATDSLLGITETSDENLKDFLDFFQKWAVYKRTTKINGKQAATTEMVAPQSLTPYIGLGYLNVNGMLPYDLLKSEEQAVIWKMLMAKINEMPAGDFDKGIMRWVHGYSYWANKDYSKSDTHLTSLLDEDTFFSPVAGVLLAKSKNKQGKHAEADAVLNKIETGYPGYADVVEKIKNKWKK